MWTKISGVALLHNFGKEVLVLASVLLTRHDYKLLLAICPRQIIQSAAYPPSASIAHRSVHTSPR